MQDKLRLQEEKEARMVVEMRLVSLVQDGGAGFKMGSCGLLTII